MTSSVPLVTYLVCGYNQEKFIREAIASAFAQTHEPMEIILSDDCSKDRTFDIMREMAAAYRGPKHVRVVRNPKNMGVFGHVLARGHDARGDIVVLAAGDDISRPERTARLVEAFTPGVACVFSRVSIIDEHGAIVVGDTDRPIAMVGENIAYLRDVTCGVDEIQGSSSAYRKWVFDLPITPRNNRYAEDFFFYNFINLVDGRIVKLPDLLVEYRTHSAALTNFSAQGGRRYASAAEEEEANFDFWKKRLDIVADLGDLASAVGKPERLDVGLIERVRTEAKCRVEWPALSLPQKLRRVCRIFTEESVFPRWKRLVWCGLRMFGHYPAYQPKVLVSRLRDRDSAR